jgi:hypothetical protein
VARPAVAEEGDGHDTLARSTERCRLRETSDEITRSR